MSGVFDFTNNSRYRAALERGTTFKWSLALRDTCANTGIDLTGFGAALTVKNSAGTTVLSATTVNGRIVVSGNRLTITVTAADTAALALGVHTYTLDVSQAAVVNRYLTGKFEIV